MTGDSYNRIEISPGSGVYQCGCHWEKTQGGDVLRECAIHHAATTASVKEFERDARYKHSKAGRKFRAALKEGEG